MQAAPSRIFPKSRLLDHPLLASLLLAVITFAVFRPVTSLDFVNTDDPGYFSANPNVLAGITWPTVRWAFHTHAMESPYPLTWLSLMLDAEFFGKGPAGPHLTNLLIHIFTAVSVFFMLRGLTGSHWTSALGAAIFAIHPLRVESVAWISERKGLLSSLFFTLAIGAYSKFAVLTRQGGIAKASKFRWIRACWYASALVLFGLALLAKPMVVTLPFLLILLDFWPFLRLSTPPGAQPAAATLRRLSMVFVEKIPFFLLAALASAHQIRVTAQAGSLTSMTNLPLLARLANAAVSYGRYLLKTLWPVNLEFPYPIAPVWPVSLVLISFLVLAGISALAVFQARRRPWLLVGWFWFLGTFAPVIGIVHWGTQAMADRYTYIPHMGCVLIFAAAMHELFRKYAAFTLAASALAGFVLVACAGRTRDQLQYWHDGESIARHAVLVTPNNADAYNNLGGFLFRAGRIDEAIEAYQRALAINRHLSAAENNLGLALATRGALPEALSHYDLAVQYSPSYAEAHVNAGNALAAQGLLDQARARYLSALRIDPNLPSALNNLGVLALKRGDTGEAETYLRRFLGNYPADPVAHLNLARVFAKQGNLGGAREELNTALRLQPEFSQAKELLESMRSPAPTPHP